MIIALIIISIMFSILFGLGFSILFWIFIWQYDETDLYDVENMDFNEPEFII